MLSCEVIIKTEVLPQINSLFAPEAHPRLPSGMAPFKP